MPFGRKTKKVAAEEHLWVQWKITMKKRKEAIEMLANEWNGCDLMTNTCFCCRPQHPHNDTHDAQNVSYAKGKRAAVVWCACVCVVWTREVECRERVKHTSFPPFLYSPPVKWHCSFIISKKCLAVECLRQQSRAQHFCFIQHSKSGIGLLCTY